MDKLALMKAALANRKPTKGSPAPTGDNETAESVPNVPAKKPVKKSAKKAVKKAVNYSFFQKAKTRGA